MTEYTEKQKEQRKQAVLRYQKTVDRVNCMFPSGTKERILKYADSYLNQLSFTIFGFISS